ncbi:hypothetical protein, partial [Microcoleus sp. herbarium12]|uniref:hypothetical protein n=1 Tax=Microcoleus sp. herbarium12 TaxID=3055437 RepID=UPI002FD54CA1
TGMEPIPTNLELFTPTYLSGIGLGGLGGLGSLGGHTSPRDRTAIKAISQQLLDNSIITIPSQKTKPPRARWLT